MRDYDKEPIKIIDRAVYFQEKSLFLSIVLFYSAYTTNATFMDIIKGDDLFMVLCAVVLFIAQIWWYENAISKPFILRFIMTSYLIISCKVQSPIKYAILRI